jgi:hypothetical protein
VIEDPEGTGCEKIALVWVVLKKWFNRISRTALAFYHNGKRREE